MHRASRGCRRTKEGTPSLPLPSLFVYLFISRNTQNPTPGFEGGPLFFFRRQRARSLRFLRLLDLEKTPQLGLGAQRGLGLLGDRGHLRRLGLQLFPGCV